jgi:transcriptional regulator with XRE-family HTH domain
VTSVIAILFVILNDTFAMVADQTPDVQQLLAANLRRLRIARHLSLSELARATGMSKATLSGVENGRSNPTVETLSSLAGALRVPLVELLEQPAPDEVRVVRAARSPLGGDDGVRRRALDALEPAGQLRLSELALDPGTMHELEPQAAGSRAHVYVVHGKLIAGPVERATELAAGDYASFPIDVPHIYETRRQGIRALLITDAGGPRS